MSGPQPPPERWKKLDKKATMTGRWIPDEQETKKAERGKKAAAKKGVAPKAVNAPAAARRVTLDQEQKDFLMELDADLNPSEPSSDAAAKAALATTIGQLGKKLKENKNNKRLSGGASARDAAGGKDRGPSAPENTAPAPRQGTFYRMAKKPSKVSSDESADPYAFNPSSDDPLLSPVSAIKPPSLPGKEKVHLPPAKKKRLSRNVIDLDSLPEPLPPTKHKREPFVISSSCQSPEPPSPSAPTLSSYSKTKSNNKIIYDDAVLARYAKDSLYYPARLIRAPYGCKEITVEYINGERVVVRDQDVVRRHEPRFQRVKLGKLPMAKEGDTRTLEERRTAEGFDDRPSIPDLEQRLERTVHHLKEIAEGEKPDMWRFREFKKGSAAASKRLLTGAIQAYFTEDEMHTIGTFVLKAVKRMNTVAENETQRRRLAVDVLIPEGLFRRGRPSIEPNADRTSLKQLRLN